MEHLQDKMQILYEKGISAFQSGNLDYAITLFRAVLDSSPDYAPARTQLRLAEFRRFQNYRFPLWHKIISFIPSIKAVLFGWKKNWQGLLKELEKPLIHYPKNYTILRRLAGAAERADMPETVCSIYETMYLVKPADIFVLKKLGKYYRELNESDKAYTYYQRALAIAPLDYEAHKGVQDLEALGTINKGWEEKGTYREKLKDEKQADLFEKENRLVRSSDDRHTLITELEKELAKQPDSIPLIKKLAGLYISAEDYHKAVELYKKAVQLNPADITLRKEILNAKIAQLDKEGRIKEKNELIFKDTQERVKKFPTNLGLHYEMGSIYMERKMWDEATAEFQSSVKDPKYKILSLNKLGLCFYKKGIYDLAINQFKKAVEELYDWNKLKKEIIYNTGATYEAMGKKEKALAEYKKIYEQDINYRDISSKISSPPSSSSS